MPRSKPYPDVYLAAASALGVDPRRCAVVEDTVTGATADDFSNWKAARAASPVVSTTPHSSASGRPAGPAAHAAAQPPASHATAMIFFAIRINADAQLLERCYADYPIFQGEFN